LTNKIAGYCGGKELLPATEALRLFELRPNRAPTMHKSTTLEVSTPNRKANTPRCAICNGSFGLIRYRFAHKQFCSKQCLERYVANTKKKASGFKQWIDFSRNQWEQSGSSLWLLCRLVDARLPSAAPDL